MPLKIIQVAWQFLARPVCGTTRSLLLADDNAPLNADAYPGRTICSDSRRLSSSMVLLVRSRVVQVHSMQTVQAVDKNVIVASMRRSQLHDRAYPDWLAGLDQFDPLRSVAIP